MSYARWGEGSDVYVFVATDGAFECCGCVLVGHGQETVGSYRTATTAAMLDHLAAHRAAGHAVPDSCVAGLAADAAANDRFAAERAAPGA